MYKANLNLSSASVLSLYQIRTGPARCAADGVGRGSNFSMLNKIFEVFDLFANIHFFVINYLYD
jgi:hypothetical protein